MREIEHAMTGAAASNASADPFAGPGEMRRRCGAFDWSATPLGPVNRWPHSLRVTVQVVLASPFPSVVLWGDRGCLVYRWLHAASR